MFIFFLPISFSSQIFLSKGAEVYIKNEDSVYNVTERESRILRTVSKEKPQNTVIFVAGGTIVKDLTKTDDLSNPKLQESYFVSKEIVSKGISKNSSRSLKKKIVDFVEENSRKAHLPEVKNLPNVVFYSIANTSEKAVPITRIQQNEIATCSDFSYLCSQNFGKTLDLISANYVSFFDTQKLGFLFSRPPPIS